MDCRSCGADLHHDAAYCQRCGTRVELGSVLGVGTDLPSVPGLSRTAALPRQQSAPPSEQAARPAQAEPFSTPTTGHSRGSVLAMVATFVVLTLIGTFALTRLFGSGAPEPSVAVGATPSATSRQEGRGPSATSPVAPDARPSTTRTPFPPERSSAPGVDLPAAARSCSVSGSDAVAQAYAATDRTSCEFAASVRDAYRTAGTPEGATTLRAWSPVTEKWYSLSCDGGAPVRCTSTTDAVVLLAP
ncbi:MULTISPECIES: hypothetical protein [unclassified Knoellia]|uniref:hypothetical protein n=1 Tax=Knoellia altitudinis TaxID=3404795 RepID=UPI00361E22E6